MPLGAARFTLQGGLDLGSLELIEEQTFSSVSNVTFTNSGNYAVHFVNYIDLQFSNADTLRARVSNDGGSSYESTSQYDIGLQLMKTNGTFSENPNKVVADLIEYTLDKLVQ